MFFVLSKTAALILLPSNFLIGLALIGTVLLATRWNKVGLRLAVSSIVLLAILGFLPIGNALIHPLEARFPPWEASPRPPNGIIVLGGAISPRLSRAHNTTIIDGDAERLFALVDLARRYPDARIVYSGGDASLMGNQGRESDFVYSLLDGFGISHARLILENKSRNTAENAFFSKQAADPRPGDLWLLVTSADHMPRAIGCFRKVGFAVEAYPVGWRTSGVIDFHSGKTFADGLRRFDAAAYEWIGLLAYRLTGKTNELFPSP
ncbi:MAG TPA: YdcF family protein [Pseudolabrys sp.]|nr:YdcF family protein [Pseudolabrys sp.]